MRTLLKQPSAWIPLVLTGAMLLVFVLYFTSIIPPDPSGDEGTGAHLFQIWAVLEVVTIFIFGLKWIHSKSRETITILVLQIVFALIPFLIVFSLHL